MDPNENYLQALIARELGRMSSSLPAEPRMSSEEFVKILDWLGPFVRDTLVRGIEIGIQLEQLGASGDVARAEAEQSRGLDEQAGDEEQGQRRTAPTSIQELLAAQGRIESVPTPAMQDGEDVSAPWLLEGQVTLLASPFNSFGDVQQFLTQLTQVPGIVEAKPKRFGRGRLYVSLITELHESDAVADAIATALVPYHPQVKSIQPGLIEIRVDPPAA